MGSCYDFNLLTAFLPNYAAHERVAGFEKTPEYTYQYKIVGRSDQPITYLSAPIGAFAIMEENRFIVEKTPETILPKRDIHVYYRTQDMATPSMLFEVSDDKREVACMASFVPTFEPKNP